MTEDRSNDFGPFDGRIWLNASHQGPLPKIAIEAAHRAVDLKRAPQALATSTLFSDVPARLREALGRLLNADPDDIILGNSASYGMHLLALGIRLTKGDEVLVVEGDFPATILPWTLLGERGVAVRFLRPKGSVLSPDELRAALSPKTRVFATTWVHSFTGFAVDEMAMGEVCRANGTHFILNASQAVGARPITVTGGPFSAVVGCGFKWLCGPYGTGYCWIDPNLRDQMHETQRYWLAHFTADDLKRDRLPELRTDLGARAYDVFGTANFNNFMPWTASIEYLLGIGIDMVADHDRALITRFTEAADRKKYEILSPDRPPAQSTIVIVSHRNRARNASIFERLRAEGIDNSFRRGNLRFAPHIYNTPDEIDRAAAVLNKA